MYFHNTTNKLISNLLAGFQISKKIVSIYFRAFKLFLFFQSTISSTRGLYETDIMLRQVQTTGRVQAPFPAAELQVLQGADPFAAQPKRTFEQWWTPAQCAEQVIYLRTFANLDTIRVCTGQQLLRILQELKSKRNVSVLPTTRLIIDDMTLRMDNESKDIIDAIKDAFPRLEYLAIRYITHGLGLADLLRDLFDSKNRLRIDLSLAMSSAPDLEEVLRKFRFTTFLEASIWGISEEQATALFENTSSKRKSLVDSLQLVDPSCNLMLLPVLVKYGEKLTGLCAAMSLEDASVLPQFCINLKTLVIWPSDRVHHKDSGSILGQIVDAERNNPHHAVFRKLENLTVDSLGNNKSVSLKSLLKLLDLCEHAKKITIHVVHLSDPASVMQPTLETIPFGRFPQLTNIELLYCPEPIYMVFLMSGRLRYATSICYKDNRASRFFNPRLSMAHFLTNLDQVKKPIITESSTEPEFAPALECLELTTFNHIQTLMPVYLQQSNLGRLLMYATELSLSGINFILKEDTLRQLLDFATNLVRIKKCFMRLDCIGSAVIMAKSIGQHGHLEYVGIIFHSPPLLTNVPTHVECFAAELDFELDRGSTPRVDECSYSFVDKVHVFRSKPLLARSTQCS